MKRANRFLPTDRVLLSGMAFAALIACQLVDHYAILPPAAVTP